MAEQKRRLGSLFPGFHGWLSGFVPVWWRECVHTTTAVAVNFSPSTVFLSVNFFSTRGQIGRWQPFVVRIGKVSRHGWYSSSVVLLAYNTTGAVRAMATGVRDNRKNVSLYGGAVLLSFETYEGRVTATQQW